MKRFLAALALTVLAALPARAANIQNIDLGKNAEVWFAEDHTVPIISFNISLPAGSAFDPAGKAGLANFAASMMDEGAGGLDSKAFHEALADRAISFSARAERDYLVISISTLKENAPEAMHLLQLALTRPRFEAEALTRVRAQIIQSLEQDAAEPPRVASRVFMREFFGDHAYAHPVAGEIGSVSSVTVADLRNFARSHWTKHGLKVAVAGDITATVLTGFWGIRSCRCQAPCLRPCPMSGGWAHRACMWFRCRCRNLASISACPASCAITRISFPAMSPIMSWAAAGSRRG
jgi:zinc protease